MMVHGEMMFEGGGKGYWKCDKEKIFNERGVEGNNWFFEFIQNKWVFKVFWNVHALKRIILFLECLGYS